MDDKKADLAPKVKIVLALVQGLLPAMTAIVGGLWIAGTYLDHQRQTQRDGEARASHEAETRRVEAQRPFLEKQLSLYFEAAQVAGQLVTLTADDKDWEKIERRFWALYWSELSMVEDRIVEAGMVEFGDRLDDYTSIRKTAKDHNQPFDETESKRSLNEAALNLAHAIRQSIEIGWSGRTGKPPAPASP